MAKVKSVASQWHVSSHETLCQAEEVELDLRARRQWCISELPLLEWLIRWGVGDEVSPRCQWGSSCSILSEKWWKLDLGSDRATKRFQKKIDRVWKRRKRREMTESGDLEKGGWLAEVRGHCFWLFLWDWKCHLSAFASCESRILGCIHELYEFEVSVLLS